MSRPGPLSERAVILTPGGRDGQIAALILHQAGFPAEVSADLPALCGELEQGAGLAIIADEAVHTADLRSLALLLERQPPWSDLPIIMLTRRGGGPERNPTAARLAHLLGNVVFLERPFHPTTLASMVRTAVRSRRRQYEARARLEELSEGEQRLSNLTRTLEQRVEARTADLIAEVAARERAQEQLRQSQKMESLGQLTGGIAHDFNNLLMAVVGNLELLRKRIPDDARMQRLIEGALLGAVRGASLTRRLLAFARQQDLKTAPTDLGKLLQGMRDLLERSLGPRIALRFAVAKELPLAEVDANQLELGILNVAINARDAMPDGGLIDISLDQEIIPDGQALRPGTYLRVRIADTGTGMDEATLKRAVEPFFSSKPIGKGTGLGLSMVHGLATQLGGAFSLSSQLGKGTVAQLLLPVSTSPLDLIEETRIETSPARFATVLVVEDDSLIAMSTVAMLEDLGHTAIEANSGQKAVEILRGEQDLDLMITDQAMPSMTGVELARMAREIRPAMPILLATGYTDVAAGGADLPRLSKPYHQSQLQTEIDKLLNSREESPGRRPSLLHGLRPSVPRQL